MSLTAPLARTRRPRRPGQPRRAWRRAISPLALLAVWQLASTTGVLPREKLDSPLNVLDSLVGLWTDGRLLDAIQVSVTRVLVGFALGAVVGVGLAVVAGLSRLGEDVVDAPMQMLRTLPHFGLLPLFILWFGIDEAPKYALIALGVAFPLYVNTFAGIRGVDPKYLDAARAFGLTWTERLRHVVLPGALPSTLVGLRLSLGVAWLTLIVVADQHHRRHRLPRLRRGRVRPHRRGGRRPAHLQRARAAHRRARPHPREEGPRMATRLNAPHALRPPTVPPTVQVRGLRRSFGDTVVLDDLDLDVAPGELVALLGRSGSGKSTLLRLLAGLDAPDAGTAEVDGVTSVAFQEPRLLPWRRVAQNVALGLRTGSRRDRDGRARELLGEVGLTEKADVWPVTLSGGQAQRASLARALVSEPGLLLLDEPFSALDALTRIEMHDLLLRVWARHRASVLLVTHDVDEALLLADRVIVLDQGRVAHSLHLDLPRPRALHDPRLVAHRATLLDQLGVHAAHAAASPTTDTAQEAVS